MINNKTLILEEALKALKEKTRLTGEYEEDVRSCFNKVNDDGILTLRADDIPATWQFRCQIKKELLPHHLTAVDKLLLSNSPSLIIAKKISQSVKQLLKTKKISFIESIGNIYIETGTLYILIEGNKHSEPGNQFTNRAFASTGLRLVFNLLLDTTLINLSYREIVKKLDISYANVAYIFKDLEKEGFIPYNKRGFRALKNKKELVNRWMYAYSKKLKPDLLLGRYKFLNKEKFNDWASISFDSNDTAWGGEPAGDLLTNYLKPETLTIYTEEPILILIKKMKIVPSRDGNIFIYQKFWKSSENSEKQIAPLLLVYTDLMTSNDERCLETAGIIYEKYISTKLSED
ncbi:hypothetical protein MASR2M39_07040 [Ignavibacteriales bacterium]